MSGHWRKGKENPKAETLRPKETRIPGVEADVRF
jgi:hypothetical protein